MSGTATVRTVLELALRAASVHNAQPWRFRDLDGCRVEVRLDSARALPAVDPIGRQLLISLGSLISSARWVARGLGVALSTHTGIDDATVLEVKGHTPMVPGVLEAVAARRTCRVEYRARAVPANCQRDLEALEVRGASLVVVDNPRQLELLSRLVASGTRRAFSTPAFRKELAVRLGGSKEASGILPPASGLARVGRWVQAKGLEHLDVGALRADENKRLTVASAAVLLVVTEADDASAWIASGEALADAWLTATRHGLVGQPMTAAIEASSERQALSEALGGGAVQALLRIGELEHPLTGVLTERRPLDSFWDQPATRGLP